MVTAQKHNFKWYIRRILNVLIESLPSFGRNECPLRASALTYYSLFAIVPVFALLFGVAKGFGLDEWLKKELSVKMAEHTEILDRLYYFADTTLREARGGLVAGIGALILCWTVVKMIGNIEGAFNQVWQVRKGRSIFRKFTDYLSFLVIAPVLTMAMGSATVLVSSYLKSLTSHHEWLGIIGLPLIEFSMLCVPYILAWILFSFVYIFLPNTRVNLSAAIFGGIIAGSLYQLLQSLYIYVQMALSRYNVIYGSFSALPLFLIWMYLSWVIVLFGVILSYLYQNFDYESKEACDKDLSFAEKRLLALWLCGEITADFARQMPPLSTAQLAKRCNLSYSLSCELLERLANHGLIVAVNREEFEESCYIPALPLEQMTVTNVLLRYDQMDADRPRRETTSPALGNLTEALKDLRKSLNESAGNRSLLELFNYSGIPHDKI